MNVADEAIPERETEVAQPAPQTVSRFSPDRIGELVSSYRKARKLKVSELARSVGVTPSLISQIERGHSRPSVATLFALADALDVPVDAFSGSGWTPDGASAERRSMSPFTAGPVVTTRAQRYVVRRGDRASIEIEGGVTWEMLTPSTSSDFEFLEIVYEPGAQSNQTRYRHPGSEMVLMLEGTLQIDVGFETYTLTTGDSIHFPSTTPHRYVNPTDSVARAVTVILHDPHAANTHATTPPSP